MCPIDDGVVGDYLCRNALFSLRCLVKKNDTSSVGIRITRQRGHPRSRTSANCKSSSVMQQIVIFVCSKQYVTLWNSLVLSLRIFLLYIALRHLTWPWPTLFFLLPVTLLPYNCAQIPHIEQYGGIFPHFFYIYSSTFFLRNFLPEFALGLCRRTPLLHAQTLYATCFSVHNFVFCLPNILCDL